MAKYELRMTKYEGRIPNLKMKMKKGYNLEQRTFEFAKACRFYVKDLPYSLSNSVDGKQLIKASGSVGANYIEADENIRDKDLVFSLRIARKEVKEAQYRLQLLGALNKPHSEKANTLIVEALELRKILSSMIRKASLRDSTSKEVSV